MENLKTEKKLKENLSGINKQNIRPSIKDFS